MKLPSRQQFHARFKMAMTDAAPGLAGVIVPTDLICPFVIGGVAKDLDDAEIVCCLFFLVEEYKTGYDAVVDVLKSKDRRISKYLEANGVTDWEAKVVEILCLLQNNEVLLNLGVIPSAAHSVYLSKVPRHATKVDVRAKTFYQLFESLSRKDGQRLLDRVYRDIPRPDTRFWPMEDSLELHLLWWIKKDLIAINGGKWSLQKLLRILKEINLSESTHYQILEEYNNENTTDSCRDNRFGINQDSPTSATDDRPAERDDKEESYQVRRGLVVVFNQMGFSGPIDYEYRLGSELDCRRIKNTFESNFGFDYEEFTDAGQEKIYSELENIGSRAKDYDCVVVFVLSHGTLHNIVASDGKECPIVTVRSKLCSEALNGIPKVLVIQACQGEGDLGGDRGLATDGPTSVAHNVDRQRHLLVFNSTIPGELSVRDPRNGTWFIQVLCDCLSSMGTKSVPDFESCAKQVMRHFENKQAIIRGVLVKQVSECTTNLTKKLVFPLKTSRNRIA